MHPAPIHRARQFAARTPEKGILLRLRFELHQYINLRPVRLYPGVETPIKGKGPDDIDFVVVRENNEDLYVGAGGFTRKGTPEEVAIQTSINTRSGVERCLRFAFELARDRGRQRPFRGLGAAAVPGSINQAVIWERQDHPRQRIVSRRVRIVSRRVTRQSFWLARLV